jgi:hypothetical protein
MPKSARKRRAGSLRESQLATPVQAWLEGQGLTVHCEVRLAAKQVDLVGVPNDPDSHPWTGVELKLFKWKRALAQATANAVVFDNNYVALWHTSVARAVDAREAFEAAGVGLISVCESGVNVVIPARAQKWFGQMASKKAIRERLIEA